MSGSNRQSADMDNTERVHPPWGKHFDLEHWFLLLPNLPFHFNVKQYFGLALLGFILDALCFHMSPHGSLRSSVCNLRKYATKRNHFYDKCRQWWFRVVAIAQSGNVFDDALLFVLLISSIDWTDVILVNQSANSLWLAKNVDHQDIPFWFSRLS